ncbi:putative mitochondrial import protein TIM15 [Lupinus albus]|uniref:Putative mitochondrial import protein TIM15 n=1 Tax=Lupinus albus TaxID=3870 RepID=A0A6A4NNT0_LUPAL|nr:putative mitochondrial import protein TIM15 [Lupinus albus]
MNPSMERYSLFLSPNTLQASLFIHYTLFSPVTADKESGIGNISTFPWSLFTKSPRRRMLVAFTCTICGQRTTRAINPHAYTLELVLGDKLLSEFKF